MRNTNGTVLGGLALLLGAISARVWMLVCAVSIVCKVVGVGYPAEWTAGDFAYLLLGPPAAWLGLLVLLYGASAAASAIREWRYRRAILRGE